MSLSSRIESVRREGVNVISAKDGWVRESRHSPNPLRRCQPPILPNRPPTTGTRPPRLQHLGNTHTVGETLTGDREHGSFAVSCDYMRLDSIQKAPVLVDRGRALTHIDVFQPNTTSLGSYLELAVPPHAMKAHLISHSGPVPHLLQSTPLPPLAMSECRRYVCPMVCGVGLSEYAVSSLKRSRGERGDSEHRRRPRSTGGSWRADTRVYVVIILPIDGDRGSMT